MNTRDQTSSSFSEKVVIKHLTPKLTSDLAKHKYFFSALRRGDVLNHGLRYEILKAAKLVPQSTRLVAYHTEEKRAIGFLYLEENTDWLYTIEYVFVDPKYRKKGLATRLLNYAMILAKEKGAKKVSLNVDANSTKAIALYEKTGFEKIGFSLLVQGYLSGSAHSRILNRVMRGQGFFAKLALERKGQLYELNTNIRKNRERLFNIYQRCMDRTWMKFFETNVCNLTNGSRNIWQPPFFRYVIINNSANSFALIFTIPFSGKATIELYGNSNVAILSMLKDLLKILAKRGVSFFQISLFNADSITNSSLFEEKRMTIFPFLTMGKPL